MEQTRVSGLSLFYFDDRVIYYEFYVLERSVVVTPRCLPLICANCGRYANDSVCLPFCVVLFLLLFHSPVH